MEAMQGSMADLSSANSTYLSTTVEEPELSSINFRQSLRFFQEQLMNSKGFPSPSQNRSEVRKFCIDFESEQNRNEISLNEIPKSLTNSRISIPTVDTILESVRVLRAIQKSQQQRGSTWSLDLLKSSDDELEIQQSSIFEDLKSANRSDSIFKNGLQYILPSSVDGKPMEKMRDKPKNHYPSQKEGTHNKTSDFWPSNKVERKDISIELDTKVASELHTNVDFQVQDKSPNAEVEIKNCIDKNKECVLEENLYASDGDKIDQNVNSESTIIYACVTNSDSDKQIQDRREQEKNLLQNGITKFSAVETSNITETSNTNVDLTFSEDAETHQTSFKDNTKQNIEECEMYKSVNGNNDENGEFFYAIENEAIQNNEPVLQNITTDHEGIQNLSSSPPTYSKQFRPESRSDTCSSIYVSAEGSPCPFLYNDLESSSEIQERINAYTSQCVDNESKDSPFETWTTESSGISADLTNDSRSNESTSSRSSTSNENILDDCSTVPEKLTEKCMPLSSFEDFGNNVEEHNISDFSTKLKDNNIEDHNIRDSFKILNDNNVEDHNISDPIPRLYENLVNKDLNNPNEVNNSNKPKECSENSIDGSLNDRDVNCDLVEKVCEINRTFKPKETDETVDTHSKKKFTTSSWNLEAITESLYALEQAIPSKIFPEDSVFQGAVLVMSQGAFCTYPEGIYTLVLQQHTLQILQETTSLIMIPLTYAEVSEQQKNILKVDNKLGKCLYFKSETNAELKELKEELELHCSKCWKSERLNLVHYPLKSHQNVVIIDLGSCSTRAGILMDQPTLPFLFFPSICAVNKKTGNHIYGKEALQLEVRQNSNLSFPLRPSIKIVKHSIDIDLIGGLFKRIFQNLRVDPVQYTVQVCLPRSLSITVQNALVKLLLEDIKVLSVSLTHQALLTLYAHNVSTGIVVDVGDRMDILPVVDGFIVESGVTRLPYGGQRLIHHMKHALAEKQISLSNDIESFVVQYISENLCYVAEDYDAEDNLAMQHPDIVKKTVALETFTREDQCAQYATLDDARFKTPEGLFKPDLWGLDNPGIHKLVQKAIQATSVDVRKKIAENIYVSGGVTMIPGFVERLTKEVSNLNKPRIVPKVIASNYRYHCTYIGACEFARMEVFPKVCVNIHEYSKNQISSLKKFVLCF